jgi:3-mercaptopyruvate sulfurtransferase SseA
MQTTFSRTHDPDRARAWFEDKLAFTTGLVEVGHMLKSGNNIIIVDVREAEDFAKGHIPGALSLP